MLNNNEEESFSSQEKQIWEDLPVFDMQYIQTYAHMFP